MYRTRNSMYNIATNVVIVFVSTNVHVDGAFFQSSPWTTTNQVKASKVASSPRSPSCALFSNNQNNKKDKDDDGDDLPFLTIAIPLVSLVAFWPLLSLLRDTNDPILGFDIDMFMALKGILDTTSESNLSEDFLELPPLSPAERLVDAIFGPP